MLIFQRLRRAKFRFRWQHEEPGAMLATRGASTLQTGQVVKDNRTAAVIADGARSGEKRKGLNAHTA